VSNVFAYPEEAADSKRILKDYIKSLVEVMHMAEDLESLENLHALCSLMQTICGYPQSRRLAPLIRALQ